MFLNQVLFPDFVNNPGKVQILLMQSGMCYEYLQKKKKIYIELGRKSGQNQKYNIWGRGGREEGNHNADIQNEEET